VNFALSSTDDFFVVIERSAAIYGTWIAALRSQ